MAKLLGGGSHAMEEAYRIIAEKALAVGETTVEAAQGRSPLAIVLSYRRAVRRNLRRLSNQCSQ